MRYHDKLIYIVIVDSHAESQFEAVSSGIGVLFVHDLDEQLYSAINSMKTNNGKSISFSIWILFAMVVAIISHCKEKDV